MTDPICPKTGAPMKRGIRPMTLAYKDESITFDMPGWYCDQSDESIHTGKDMKVSDRMLNLLKARSDGLLEPKEIRRIRKKLRVPQKTAGQVIGGGPRAFQKYESGDLLPSRAISSALILLDRDPKALTMLSQRQRRVEAEGKKGRRRRNASMKPICRNVDQIKNRSTSSSETSSFRRS